VGDEGLPFALGRLFLELFLLLEPFLLVELVPLSGQVLLHEPGPEAFLVLALGVEIEVQVEAGTEAEAGVGVSSHLQEMEI
jgi:hypothetical protein